MSIHELPIEALVESATNPRKTFGDLSQLVESIKDKGILQPLLVRPLPRVQYEVVCGHRRLRAARLAGLLELPPSSCAS